MRNLSKYLMAATLALMPIAAAAQVTVPSYVEAATGNTKNGVGTVNIGSGTSAGQIQGTATTGVPPVGNPVQNGCMVNTTAPTYTAGTMAPVQCGIAGWTIVQMAAFGNGTVTGINPGANLTYQGGAGATFANPHPLGVTPLLYNGTTMDAAVSAAGITTTGTGIAATAGVVQFNTTPATITTGQYSVEQAESDGSMRAQITGVGNTTMSALAIGANLSVQLGAHSNPHPLGTLNYSYNGTNEDADVTIVGAVAVGNTGVGTKAVEQAGTSFSEITTATTTLVKTGASVLHSVCVNTPIASATVKVYNALTAVGTPFTLTIPSTVTGESPFCMKYDVYFGTGITVVTSGLTDVTVVFGR